MPIPVALIALSGSFYCSAWVFFFKTLKKHEKGQSIKIPLIFFGSAMFFGSIWGTIASFYPFLARASDILETHQIQLQADIESKQKELEQIERDINFAEKQKEIRDLRKAKPPKTLKKNTAPFDMPE